MTLRCGPGFAQDMPVHLGGPSGHCEWRVFRPMIIPNILQCIRLLADGARRFKDHCAAGITPNRARIETLLNEFLMLSTALNPHIGYDKAAQIAKKAHQEGTTLKAAALALAYVSEAQFDAWVKPRDMVGAQL